jgi:hypothetical protein
VITRLSRRLERLEAQVVSRVWQPMPRRILFVDPQEGLTSVLLIGSGNTPMEVPPTPEEVESVWASLSRNRRDP